MINAMELPSTKRQNKWIQDYVAPILLDFDINLVIYNYKRNKREALNQKMEEAGVYDSLRSLKDYGTSWDSIVDGLKESYKNAEEQKIHEYFMTIKPVELWKEDSLFIDKPRSNHKYKQIDKYSTLNKI